MIGESNAGNSSRFALVSLSFRFRLLFWILNGRPAEQHDQTDERACVCVCASDMRVHTHSDSCHRVRVAFVCVCVCCVTHTQASQSSLWLKRREENSGIEASGRERERETKAAKNNRQTMSQRANFFVLLLCFPLLLWLRRRCCVLCWRREREREEGHGRAGLKDRIARTITSFFICTTRHPTSVGDVVDVQCLQQRTRRSSLSHTHTSTMCLSPHARRQLGHLLLNQMRTRSQGSLCVCVDGSRSCTGLLHSSDKLCVSEAQESLVECSVEEEVSEKEAFRSDFSVHRW